MLTMSEAEAQTVGMERREGRRAGRQERREDRRAGRQLLFDALNDAEPDSTDVQGHLVNVR